MIRFIAHSLAPLSFVSYPLLFKPVEGYCPMVTPLNVIPEADGY
jgi:hypothetical protein